LDLAQDISLISIAFATVIAIGIEVFTMIQARVVTLADLLLLFIYLEVLAMVASYLKSGQLPIRIPLCIAIVALASYLILDMKDMNQWRMLAVAGAAFILALTVLAIRYGHVRFPYEKDADRSEPVSLIWLFAESAYCFVPPSECYRPARVRSHRQHYLERSPPAVPKALMIGRTTNH
jgi:protein PsiE